MSIGSEVQSPLGFRIYDPRKVACPEQAAAHVNGKFDRKALLAILGDAS